VEGGDQTAVDQLRPLLEIPSLSVGVLHVNENEDQRHQVEEHVQAKDQVLPRLAHALQHLLEDERKGQLAHVEQLHEKYDETEAARLDHEKLPRVDLIQLHQSLYVLLVDAEEVDVVNEENEGYPEHPDQHQDLAHNAVLLAILAADDPPVQHVVAIRQELIASSPEGEGNILDEGQGKRHQKPHSNAKTNDEDKRPSPLHELLMRILKHMLDVERNAHREPVRQLGRYK
jgi:hypothetical protein